MRMTSGELLDGEAGIIVDGIVKNGKQINAHFILIKE